MWPDGKISGINLIDCACSITSLESLLHALREAVNHRRDECGGGAVSVLQNCDVVGGKESRKSVCGTS